MRCAIMQPTYFPWIGYFDMIDQVDEFIFLDNVQLTKRSWQVRNKIKAQEKELILGIPIIKSKSRDDLLICNAEVDDSQKWRVKHLNAINHNYKKTPYFSDFYPLVENILNNHNRLADITIFIIEEVAKKLKISTSFKRASNIKGLHGVKDELLVSICLATGADSYLSAKGSMQYINRDNLGGAFAKKQLDLYYHNYEHPSYPQMGNEFISYLGIIDLLFNVGAVDGMNVIKSGRRESIHYLDSNE